MLTVLGLAALVTLLTTPLVRTTAFRLGFLDVPGPRSSHRSPTPRGGGVAILVGVGVALVAGGAGGAQDPALLAVLGGGTLVALVGLADDRVDLPPLPRLAVQAVAASLVVRAAGGLERLPLPAPLDLELGPVLGAVIAFLWIVAVTNFYNFMDGIDGLASLQAVISAGALALALSENSPAALLAAAVAGASTAFLVFNWAPASVFLGDVGSGALGYTLASLALLAPEGRQADAVLMVGLSLFLFLADATACLFGRMARGERWHEAHRRHLYQRWVASGAAHEIVARWLGLGALATTGVALVGWWTGIEGWYWISLGLGSVLLCLEHAVVRRREAGTKRVEGPGSAGDAAI